MKNHHCILSIFGATGDLTKRKLMPALYSLEQKGQLKDGFKIICLARKEKTNDGFRREAAEWVKEFSEAGMHDEVMARLVSRIHYVPLEFSDSDGYARLKDLLRQLSKKNISGCEKIYYLAVPPSHFGTIIENLKKHGIAGHKKKSNSYDKVMFEKPFGYDLKSARELNATIRKAFSEEQIYRIDHYMAKELVQNLLVLRFANSIFEPLWNRKHISHVQITISETIGIESRGAYYDKAGALRDVMQNHMMQLLTLVAMEEPKKSDTKSIRKEKIKVLKSIAKFSKRDIKKIAVIGQYGEGIVDGKKVPAYTDEPDVGKDSATETYVAMKLQINNKMWKGVPFYVRTGKRLKEKATETDIVYKDVPFKLFSGHDLDKNKLKIRVDPYEGISIKFNAKVPGNKFIIDDVTMDFCHECKFGSNTPEAYETLFDDVMTGDQTLFTSWEEVENSWKIVDTLLEGFKGVKPFKYEAGTWGPKEADELLRKDRKKWTEPKRPAYADLIGK